METNCLHIAGIPLHYTALGQGTPVVFLHGWGCEGRFFTPAAQAIAAHCRCYLLDLPGFGQTPEPPAHWGVPEYAALVLAFLDAMGIGRAHLVCHSFGGRLGLYLGAHHPARVGRMVITGGAGLRKKRTLGYYWRVYTYKAAKRLLRSRGICRLLGALGVDVQKHTQNAGSADYRALSENMKQVFVRVVNLDLRDTLPRIQSPTVLFWGAEDTETPLWMGETMQRGIADAALIPVPGCGHFAFVEASAQFAAVLGSFLQGE